VPRPRVLPFRAGMARPFWHHPDRTKESAWPGKRITSRCGLEKLNHTQAVEPHRDALIARQFDVQPGFRLRVSGFPDLLMPDHDEASDRERVVVVGVVEPDSAA